MDFSAVPAPEGYVPCPFDSNFLIWKDNFIYTWELCLKNEFDSEGYPQRIGRISRGDPGSLDAVDLSWKIDPEYRGQKIMSQLLELFLNEVPKDKEHFAAVILKENLASFNLARKCGFEIYEELEDRYYLKF